MSDIMYVFRCLGEGEWGLGMRPLKCSISRGLVDSPDLQRWSVAVNYGSNQACDHICTGRKDGLYDPEIITSDSAIAVMLHSHNNLFSPSPISFLLLSAVPALACYSLLSSLLTVR